jgi:DNA-binding MarR family transcriptional regulator
VDQVTQLEKVGLVRRRSCPSDVRGLLAVLTDKGHEALRRAAPGHVALVREFLIDVLTPDELTVLADAFDVVGGGQRGRDTA